MATKLTSAKAGAAVPGIDPMAAALIGAQGEQPQQAGAPQQSKSASLAANLVSDPNVAAAMANQHGPSSIGQEKPDTMRAPSVELQPAKSTSNPFDKPISFDLTSQPPTTQSGLGGNPSLPSTRQAAADWSEKSIEAQKPLIESQTRAQNSDTALKEQEFERRKNLRYNHSLRGNSGRTVRNIGMNGEEGPSAVDLRTSRIGADGKAIVSTPNLDASGLSKPDPAATIAAGREMQATRNATQLANNPAVQAAKARVVAENQTREAGRISAKVNGENPQTRADSLAGMPGVQSVAIHGKNPGELYVGRGGAAAPESIAAGATDSAIRQSAPPAFKASPVPNPSLPENRPMVAGTPAFTPPQVGTITAPATLKPAAPNPGADYMDSQIAAATAPIIPRQTAPKPGVPTVANVPPAKIPGYDSNLPSTHWNNIRATRKYAAKSSGTSQDDTGLGEVASDIAGTVHKANQFVRDKVVNEPVAAIKRIGQIATDPAASRAWAENIWPAKQPGSTKTIAKPTFAPRETGSLPRSLSSMAPKENVQKVPLRPRKVAQSAIVNPRVNPMFKTAVA